MQRDWTQFALLLIDVQQRGKRFVLVAGLITSTCVLFTATSAAQSGFVTAVVSDCCADEADAHESTLSRYHYIFSRTAVDRITESYTEWRSALAKLDQLRVEKP